jgi:hypothetical protein
VLPKGRHEQRVEADATPARSVFGAACPT